MFTAIALSAYLVLGDSMSAAHCSWAHELDSWEGLQVQVHAQPGRQIAYYEPSPDLLPYIPHAIIWMGANDARVDPDRDTLGITQTLVDDLSARGFSVVYALPPLISLPGWDTTELRDKMQQHLQGAVIVDPPQVETVDGIHPTCAGHEELAVWWFWTLYAEGIY